MGVLKISFSIIIYLIWKKIAHEHSMRYCFVDFLHGFITLIKCFAFNHIKKIKILF